MRKYGPYFLTLVIAIGFAVGCYNPRRTPLIGVANSIVNRYAYAAGTAGTVTVPTSYYATFCSAAAGTATNATVTITPCSPYPAATCSAGSAIAIPSGYSWSQNFPAEADALGDSSAIVFANTSSYVCSEYKYQ